MSLDINRIIEDSKKIQYELFQELLNYELSFYKKKVLEYFDIKEGILRFNQRNYKEVYVFGDIHGDFITLSEMLKKIKFSKIVKDSLIIFLGDYIDRGDMQIQVLNLLFYLHRFYPNNIILLRGNHERPKWLPVYPHDFPDILRYTFGRGGEEIYKKLLEIFDLMPHIVYYKDGLVFLHGGLPINEDNLHKMTKVNREILAQILWNDPFDGLGYEMSYRGIGYMFGIDITENFLKRNGFKGLIRGHEPVDGYRISQKGYTLTLFTRLGPPYYNTSASVYRFNIRDFKGFHKGQYITIHHR